MRINLTPEEWDKARKILARFRGKRPSIEVIVEAFEKGSLRGAIQRFADAAKLDIGRAIIRGLSDEAKKEERPEQQILNFTYIDEDGKTCNAYEPFDVMTVEQLSRVVNAEYRKIGAQRRKTRDLCRLGFEKFGVEFQLLLEFPLQEFLEPEEIEV